MSDREYSPHKNSIENKNNYLSDTNINSKFIPSKYLENLILSHIVQPDEEVSSVLEQLKAVQPSKETGNSYKRELISRKIEGLFTNLAKENYKLREVILSKNNKLSQGFCIELVRRLGLDINKDISPVFAQLYDELRAFASIPRERKWGQIIYDNSELKLIVKENVFQPFDIDKIDRDRWIRS